MSSAANWDNSTDLDAMLHLLHRGRKLQLFACACCRRIWQWLPDDQSRTAVELCEHNADAKARSRVTIQASRQATWTNYLTTPAAVLAGNFAIEALIDKRWASVPGMCASAASNGSIDGDATVARVAEQMMQCHLLRDIFGNPFRPVHLDPVWNGGVTVNLARTIYDERRFEDLPILGDALEDAGCDNTDILSHCRGPGPHVRGCWVIDLLLAKAV